MYFLLERLASGGATPAYALEDAVAAQIARIVAARVLVAPDGGASLLEPGLANVVEIGINSKTALQRYALRLQALIERYEPRLRAPSVAVEATFDAAAPWRLAVSGSLAADGEPRVFRFALPAH